MNRGIGTISLVVFVTLACIAPWSYAHDPFDAVDEEVQGSEVMDVEAPPLEDIFDAGTSSLKANARIIALNKITTTTQELLLPLLDVASFYNMQVRVLRCAQVKYGDNYEATDHQALVEVLEKTLVANRRVFYGWLSSNNLWTSNIAHPVYHVILKACE